MTGFITTLFGRAWSYCRLNRVFLALLIVIASLFMSGCRNANDLASPEPPSTQAAQNANQQVVDFASGRAIDEIFPRFIAGERVAIAARDLDRLGAFWAADAQIIDQRGSEDTEDDYIWRGRSAILDRYQVAVFPFDPPIIEPPTGLALFCDVSQKAPSVGATAEGLPCLDESLSENGRILEYAMIHAQNGGDLWSFVYQQGRWWIWRLQYN